MAAREVVALVAFAALVLGCSACSKDSGSSPTKDPSPVSVSARSGTCDDVERCALECNGTNGDACRRLAVVYEFGKNDAGRNERLAASFYDRSCALGDAPGCVSSAQMHEHGHGVPSNLTFAAGAYSRACTLGSNVGCANWERVKALTSAAPAASAAP